MKRYKLCKAKDNKFFILNEKSILMVSPLSLRIGYYYDDIIQCIYSFNESRFYGNSTSHVEYTILTEFNTIQDIENAIPELLV